MGQADPVARGNTTLPQGADHQQGVVPAAAGYPLGSGSRLVQAGGVSLLVQGQDDLQPSAVDLTAAFIGQVGQLGPVVPDHVTGSGAQAHQIIGQHR